MDEVGVEVGVKGVAILDASMTNKGSDGVATQTKDQDLRFFKASGKRSSGIAPMGLWNAFVRPLDFYRPNGPLSWSF
jgi:hypothetical protein